MLREWHFLCYFRNILHDNVRHFTGFFAICWKLSLWFPRMLESDSKTFLICNNQFWAPYCRAIFHCWSPCITFLYSHSVLWGHSSFECYLIICPQLLRFWITSSSRSLIRHWIKLVSGPASLTLLCSRKWPLTLPFALYPSTDFQFWKKPFF